MAIQRRPWHTLLDKDHRGLIPEEYVRYGLRSAVKVLHGMITSKSCETSEDWITSGVSGMSWVSGIVSAVQPTGKTERPSAVLGG